MGLFSWRQWFSRKVQASRRRSPRRPVRLEVEALEVRMAPATDIWTGADALIGKGNNWSDAKNWSGGTPTAGMDLIFQGALSGAALTSNNDLTAGTEFNSITVEGSNYTIKGHSITLGTSAGGTSLVATAGITGSIISFDVAMGGAFGGNQFVNIGQGSDLTLSGHLSGAAGSQLSKEGTGELILKGDNSNFEGNVAIDQGVLQITNAKALGDAAGNFTTTVQANAQLQLNGFNGTVNEKLILNGQGATNDGALLNVSGTNVWAGPVTLDSSATLGSSAGSVNVTGQITDRGQGFNLTKEGVGQVILSAANTYRGQTIVNNGILTIRNAQALGDPKALGAGTAASGTVVNSTITETGTLQIEDPTGVGFTVQNELLTLNGPGYNPGTGVTGALDNLNGNNTWAGSVVLGSLPPFGSNVTIASETTGSGANTTPTNLTISGVISDVQSGGPYTLTKIGPGRITFTNRNTYDGLTTVAAGYLRIEDSQALGLNTDKKNQGTFVNQGGALELYADPTHTDSVTGKPTSGPASLDVKENVTLYGQGVNTQGGALVSVQGINVYAGTISLFNPSSAPVTDAIGVDPAANPSSTNAYFTADDSLTVTGNISGIRPTTLEKVGTGQLILPNANTYVGNTTVQAGWITVENNQALGAAIASVGDTQQPTVNVEAGAAVHLKATATDTNGNLIPLNLTQNFILSGLGITHPFTLINQAGALENLDGNNTVSGLVQVINGVGIGVEKVDSSPSQLTLTGQIGNAQLATSFNQSASGGSQEQDFFYDTGATSGTMTVNYNMFSIPDDLRVYYDGKLIYDTGSVSGSSSFTINYGPGASTTVEIVMDQGGGLSGTAWTFGVSFKPNTATNGTIEKLGSQQLNIQGPGTYTNPVEVVAGILQAQNNTALGAPNGATVTVDSGAALELNSSIPTENGGIAAGIDIWDRHLVLNGTGNSTFLTTGDPNPLSSTTVYSNGLTSTIGSPPTTIAPLTVLSNDNSWEGPITFNNNAIIDTEPGTRLIVDGVIDDGASLKTPPPAADLTKIGTGELTLAGANTYRGTTWINQGVVTVANSQGLGAVPAGGATTPAGWPAGAIPGGTVVASGASVQVQGDVSIADPLSIQGQGPATATGINPDWFQIGPAPIEGGQTPGNNPVTGRITGVSIDPSDNNVIYVSAAGGGGWKTIDGGQTWQPMFDQESTSSPVPLFSGAIAVAPSNPHIIYLGTGEADNSGDSFYGTGVYKSIDSGRTWTLLTGTSTDANANPIYGQAVSKIVVDPTDPNRIYVATSDLAANEPLTTDSIGGPGVWRYDASDTWFDLTNVVSANRATKPKTPGPDDDYRVSFPQSTASWSDLALVNGTLYAALGTAFGDPQHPLPNPLPASGLPTNAVFRTANPTSNAPIWDMGDGKADSESSKEFPNGISGAVNGNIKITAVPVPGGPITIYAAITDPSTGGLLAIEKSTDGGVTWAAVSAAPPNNSQGNSYLGDQGYYDSTIVAKNDGVGNTVYVGGQDDFTGNNYVLVTTDGGGTWKDITVDGSGNGPHTDLHGMALDTQGRLVITSDGGVWRYDPSTKLWSDLNGNLATVTFNSVSVDPTNPNRIFGGSQDNGAEEFTGSQQWTWVDSGDGGVALLDPVHTNVVYHVQNDTLQRSTTGGGVGSYSTVFTLTSGNGLYFDAQIDNVNTSRLLLGSDGFTSYTNTNGSTTLGLAGVYQSLDQGSHWSYLGPKGFLGTGIQSLSGATYQGVWAADPSFKDAPDNGSNTYDPNTIYALTTPNFSGGQDVYVTKDLGQSWVLRDSGLSSSSFYSAVVADPRNRDTAYLVSNDPIGAGNPRVLLTTTAGLAVNGANGWTDATGDLPDLPVNTLTVDPRNGYVYLGTDEGVYYTTDINTPNPDWKRLGVGLPDVQVTSIQINQALNVITVGTYGRSAYQLMLDDTPASGGALRVLSGTAVWTGAITLTGQTTVSASGTQDLQNGVDAASLEIVGGINDNSTTGTSLGYGLTKVGQGTLILSGPNTYSGATDIQAGLVIVRNSNALGSTASPGTTVENAAALEMQSDLNGVHLFLNGNGYTFNDHSTGALFNGSGNNTVTGPITLQTNTTIGVASGSTLTLPNTISDPGTGKAASSLTKELTGTLVLAGSNTYHGNTFVSQGVLEITNANALGAGGATTFVSDGAQLLLEAPVDGNGNPIDFTVASELLVLSGTGIFNTGALLDDRGSDTWQGGITLTSLADPTGFPSTVPQKQVAIGITNPTETFTVSGLISEVAGNGIKDLGIESVGPGTLVLSGGNSFTGSSSVLDGLLIIEDSDALGTGAGSTTTVSPGAELELKANPLGKDSVTGTANLSVNVGLALSGTGLSPANNGVLYNASGLNTWAGPVTMQANSTIGVAAATSLTVSGPVGDGGAGATLTKIGTGTLALSGANTYTGQTLVNAGVLNLQSNTALGGNGNGGTTVADGASLQMQGGITVSNATLSLTGKGFNNTGALDSLSGANTWANTITLAGNTWIASEIDSSNKASVLTVSSPIGDNSKNYTLTKTGPGTVDLTAANTYGGTTTVNQGTLLVDGSIGAASLNGGTLGGTGTIASVSATSNGGTLAPGDGTSAAGILTVNGDVTLDSAATYLVYILTSNTLPSGYSQLDANGNVALGSATLAASLGYSPTLGTSFTPIQTTGSGHTVSGTFAQGTTAVLGGQAYDITYNSTNVVLTRDIATTTTTLVSNTAKNTAVYGQPVTFTATVTPEAGITGAPQGKVDFYLNGSLTPADTETLTANSDGTSSAAFDDTALIAPGTYTVLAKYEGDPSNYKPSSSQSLTETVTTATPTVSVTGPATTPVTGQPFTVTATVTPPYNGAPQGTVNFYLGNSTTPLNSTPIPLTNVGGKQQASYTFSNGQPAANSPYAITAKFTDTDNDFTNASGSLSQTVNKDATTTAITITPTPPGTTVDYGTVTISAAVSANKPGAGNPTGTVTFEAVSTDGKTDIKDTEKLNSSDVATMTQLLPVLAPGQDYTLTATYNADNNYATSNDQTSLTVAKATTTVTVTGPSATPVYGQNITFTATVSPEDMGTPGGTVDFVIDGTTVESGVALDKNDQATYSTSTLGVNGSPHSVTVNFHDSDGNFQDGSGSLSGGQSVTVATSTTTVALTSPAATPVTGQPVTFTATISPQYSGSPQGTVNFYLGSTGNTPLNSSPVNVSNGTAAVTLPNGLTADHSPYSVYAVFTDTDGNFTGSDNTANPLSQTVAKDATTATVSSSSANDTSTYGDQVTFTAIVTANTPGTGNPTGKVDFYQGSTKIGSGTLALSGSDDEATYQTTLGQLPGGKDQITVAYEGDNNYKASPTSAVLTQTVNAAATTTGAVTYTAPESPPAVGDTITFSVTVSSQTAGIGSPTGTVDFYDNTNTKIGSGTLSDNGNGTATATAKVNNLLAGSHSITATYDSDGNFATSSSASATSVTVTKANTTTTLSPSGNEIYGQTLVTATVSPTTSNAVTPTGTVNFTAVNGGTTITDNNEPLNSKGVATMTTLLPVGSWTISATYSGDNDFNNSATTSSSTETVTRATTATQVAGPATTPVTGQSFTVTATVSPQFAGAPQGTVNFYLGTSTTPLNSSPITLNSSEQASYTFGNGLTADHSPYSITAKFTDTDGNFTGSDNTASPLSQAVTKDATTATVASSSSGDTSNYGDQVTFTATVTANSPGTGNPTGTVDFYDAGAKIGSGTLAVDGSGDDVASYQTSATQLPGGKDQITAVYDGDKNFTASPASAALTQTVNAAPTTTGTVTATWSNSPTPPVSGQKVTLTATVSSQTSGIGAPTGTLNFFDGTTLIGSGTLSDNGNGTATATADVTNLGAGSHSLTAKYQSDGNFAASKSTSSTALAVTQASTTTAVNTSNANATYGQTPVTAAVTANSPGSGPPTGQVTFTAAGGGNTYTDTETLDGSGKATMTTLLPVLPTGQSYSITAAYAGDNNYKASPASAAITQAYATASDQVTVVSNADPSLDGQSVTFTAVLTPQYAGSPMGAVVFKVDGSVPSDEPSGGETVSGGKAQYTTSALTVGTHSVSASYTSSNANFANNSGVLAGGQTVNASAPPPPPPPPSNSGGNNASPAPAFDFNHEFSLLETDAIYFAFYDQLAALNGFADQTLDAYVNYFLEQIYANPLTFTSSGSYAISLGYDIGLYYFDITQL